MTALDIVAREAARRFGDRLALVHGERRVTYSELDDVVGRHAGAMAAAGVRAGDLVALTLPNGPEFVVTYLALARLDAVTTAVSPRYTASERTAVLAQANPALVIGSDEFAALQGVAHAPYEGASSPDRDAPEAVVFTSGTTGTPKGATFTSRQIQAITALDTGGVWGGTGAQLAATGMAHVGFMTKLAGSLQSGATLHLLTRWRAEDALAIIAAERIAYVGGVGAQISLLLRVPNFDEYDLSAVQGVIAGGGPSPPALILEARRRFGAGYSVRYSSTESGGLGTLTAFDAPDEETLHTVGRPRPGTELEIRAPDTDRVLATGEIGRICMRSPAVMAGYWRDPVATAVALDGDGWLRTDDLGFVGADGCLRVTGRLSEMFIRGGYNVYPLEVEAVLLEHPAVAAVAVVPRPSSVMGEIGVAVVVPRPGVRAPTLDDLRGFASDRLAPYKLPEAIRFVDALPLTGSEKVDRRALAAHERAGAT